MSIRRRMREGRSVRATHRGCARRYAVFTWMTLTSCQAVLGVDDYQVAADSEASEDSEDTEQGVSQELGAELSQFCHTHEECPSFAPFCTAKNHCASLQSDECAAVGPTRDPNALVFGTLFAISGPDAQLELARQQAVQLAAEEINAAGGVPATSLWQDANNAKNNTHAPRKLVLVQCDVGAVVGQADRAAAHLARLGAGAAIGLTESDGLLRVLRTQTLPSGVLTMSTAIAPDGINALLDADLSWLVALTVEQRAPLTYALLAELEQHLQAQRAAPPKLALVSRRSTSGDAELAVLLAYKQDGQPLGALEAVTDRLRVDRYPSDAPERAALLESYRRFAPDLVVMTGGPELVSELLVPLERALDDAQLPPDARPHYMFTEAAKGPELLSLVRERPSLRNRVHGVGAVVPVASRGVFERFAERYERRFGDTLAAASRVGAAYDAAYALAYAVAAIEPEREYGGRIAHALHRLDPPGISTSPIVEVGPDMLGVAFSTIARGMRVAVHGTAGKLYWGSTGSLEQGELEAWCIASEREGSSETALRYGSAAMRYSLGLSGFETQPASCDAWLGADAAQMTAVGSGSAQATAAAAGPEPSDASAQADREASSDNADTPEAQTKPDADPASSTSDDSDVSVDTQAAPSAGVAGGGATAAPEAARAARLACGADVCSLDQQQCCVQVLRPLGSATLPDDVRCAPLADAAAGAAGSGLLPACVLSLRCGSDADCAEGEACCADAQQARCVAEGACAQTERRLACRSQADCGQGSVCCLHAGAETGVFEFSACEASCGLATSSVRVCETDVECADETTSTVCNPSALLPVLRVCWPRL